MVMMEAWNQIGNVFFRRHSWANVAGLIEPFCKPGAPNRVQWWDETTEISLLPSPDGLC